MKAFNVLRPLISLQVLLLLAVSGFAQTEAEAGDGNLYLQSTTGAREVIVSKGAKVSVRYDNSDYMYHDMEFKGATDSAAVFGTDTVGLKHVREIVIRNSRTHRQGQRILIWSGIITGVFWLSVAAMILLASSSNYALLIISTILVGILALPATLAMPTGVVVGIVLLLIANKRHRIPIDWTLHTKGGGK